MNKNLNVRTVWKHERGWKKSSVSYTTVLPPYLYVCVTYSGRWILFDGLLLGFSLFCQLKNSGTKCVALRVAVLRDRQFLTAVSAVAVHTIQDITPWTSLTASRKNYGVKTRNAARSLDRNQSHSMVRFRFVPRRYYTAVYYLFSFHFRELKSSKLLFLID